MPWLRPRWLSRVVRLRNLGVGGGGVIHHYTGPVTSAFSWVDLVSLVVALISLFVTGAIFAIGRRLSFRQQREREHELRADAWKVLKPIRVEGLNSKVILMNVARYKRGYDGRNDFTLRGQAYMGQEIIGIVHGGIEMIADAVYSYIDADGHRTLTETEEKAPNVIAVGHIPWEWIEDIVPEGDEFDGSPIIFVNCKAPGRSPYNFITYKEGLPVPFGPHDRDYYAPLPALGTARPQFFRDWWSFGKNWLQARRMESRSRLPLGGS